jgi:hypothetical protein
VDRLILDKWNTGKKQTGWHLRILPAVLHTEQTTKTGLSGSSLPVMSTFLSALLRLKFCWEKERGGERRIRWWFDFRTYCGLSDLRKGRICCDVWCCIVRWKDDRVSRVYFAERTDHPFCGVWSAPFRKSKKKCL